MDEPAGLEFPWKESVVKKAILLAGLAASMAIVGCQNKSGSNSTAETTDQPLYTSNPAPAPAYEPTPMPATPVSASPVSSSGSAVSMGSGNYTVKKGDTLYGIARAKYGDGKQWKRIAEANPGLDPNKIKVGQTIVIP